MKSSLRLVSDNTIHQTGAEQNTRNGETDDRALSQSGDLFFRDLSDQQQESGNAGEFLNPERLYDADSNSTVAQFMKFADQVIRILEESIHCLNDGDNLSADAHFMEAKALIPELFMFRELSDSVGLVTGAAYEAIQSISVVTDAPEFPRDLSASLSKLKMRPFMTFNEARTLSRELRTQTEYQPVPGYNELVNLILDNESEDDAETQQ